MLKANQYSSRCPSCGAKTYSAIYLTPKETLVAERLLNAEPRLYKSIAFDLGLSVSTVKIHLWNLFKKFKVHSKADLMEAYRKWR